MVGTVGVSLVIGVELIFWGWCLCRWDRVWVVLCCAFPLYLDFADFFILFGLWCQLRCS